MPARPSERLLRHGLIEMTELYEGFRMNDTNDDKQAEFYNDECAASVAQDVKNALRDEIIRLGECDSLSEEQIEAILEGLEL